MLWETLLYCTNRRNNSGKQGCEGESVLQPSDREESLQHIQHKPRTRNLATCIYSSFPLPSTKRKHKIEGDASLRCLQRETETGGKIRWRVKPSTYTYTTAAFPHYSFGPLSFGRSTAAAPMGLHAFPRLFPRHSTGNRRHSTGYRGHSTGFHGHSVGFHGMPLQVAKHRGGPWH